MKNLTREMNTQAAVETAQWLETARTLMNIEAESISAATNRLNGYMASAVDIILNHPGKLVVTGIGKSGIAAQKIAATLCSTGTPAVFLHPTEAIHGNLGVYTPGDPSILISKSGSTEELIKLVPMLRQFRSPLIAIVGNTHSALAEAADVVLDAHVDREADPLGIVPTASVIVTLALGDALAAALMVARQFTELDFVRFHPGGQLGRNLYLHVADVMHQGNQVAWVSRTTLMRDVVIEMTSHPLGAACVVDADWHLEGIITDGDVRRMLQRFDDIRPLTAKDIMTVNPIAVTAADTLGRAAQVMEDRPSQISVLPVVDEQLVCLGLIRIHDVYGRG